MTTFDPGAAPLQAAIGTAFQQALLAVPISDPNPRVGCVLHDAQGATVALGHTQRAGAGHAEAQTLRSAAERSRDLTGATAYVTLEPCFHHGRTPPCCDALIAAGIKRVVASIEDPNPLVAGKGFAKLRAAGIEVVVGPGAEESRELNIGFFSRMIRKTPWVRMKAATSLDGVTALQNGTSQWITSDAARADGHAWRVRASAVLTGIGTVVADDPLLDVRLVPTERQPHLVIVDSRLDLPLTARLFGVKRRLLVYTASTDADRRSALESRGVEVVYLPEARPVAGISPNSSADVANPTQGPPKVDLRAMMLDLCIRAEVNELHVEAGHKLNGSLIRAGLVDEFLVYVAPKLLGPGQGLAALDPLSAFAGAVPLEFKSVDRVGPDLRIVARIPGRDRF